MRYLWWSLTVVNIEQLFLVLLWTLRHSNITFKIRMHKLFQFEELDCVIYIFLPLNRVNKEMTQTIKDELHKGEFSQNSLVIKQGCSTSVALICFVLDHSLCEDWAGCCRMFSSTLGLYWQEGCIQSPKSCDNQICFLLENHWYKAMISWIYT